MGGSPADGARGIGGRNDVLPVVQSVLAESLGLGVQHFGPESPLIGYLPEFDSMAVIAVLTALEERYGFQVEDDELSAETFHTVGSLVRFVEEKVGR